MTTSSTHQVSQEQISQDILDELFQVTSSTVEDVHSLLKSCERPEDDMIGNVVVPKSIWDRFWNVIDE